MIRLGRKLNFRFRMTSRESGTLKRGDSPFSSQAFRVIIVDAAGVTIIPLRGGVRAITRPAV